MRLKVKILNIIWGKVKHASTINTNFIIAISIDMLKILDKKPTIIAEIMNEEKIINYKKFLILMSSGT